MKEIYLYTYNTLSLETHGNAKSVKDNFIFEDEKDIIFEMIPNYKDFEYVYITAITTILYALKGLNEYFETDYSDFINDIESNLSTRFNDLTSPNTSIT